MDGLGLADHPPVNGFGGTLRLTVPMIARLQAFPDDWEFVGGKTKRYRQIGNALPLLRLVRLWLCGWRIV